MVVDDITVFQLFQMNDLNSITNFHKKEAYHIADKPLFWNNSFS
jgi:hypothetical protein